MKQAVLLLAHGAPEKVEDVPEYLRYVRGGQPVAREVLEEVEHRYREIGGGSPMLARTREQAEALGARLAPVPVYFAMRNWHPFIRDVMERIQQEGVERIVAICLAPQYSKTSVGFYFRRVQEARQALGMQVEVVWTKSFHDHPNLIAAFVERLKAAHQGGKVLFTAHSLPARILETGDPYDKEARNTARLVAEGAGLDDWDFAYQSQGMTAEPWLGPTVESKLEEYAAAGVRSLTLHPIGFVSDHVEVVFDVDILFWRLAGERGIRLVRPESLNSSPLFIEALAKVAAQRLV